MRAEAYGGPGRAGLRSKMYRWRLVTQLCQQPTVTVFFRSRLGPFLGQSEIVIATRFHAMDSMITYHTTICPCVKCSTRSNMAELYLHSASNAEHTARQSCNLPATRKTTNMTVDSDHDNGRGGWKSDPRYPNFCRARSRACALVSGERCRNRGNTELPRCFNLRPVPCRRWSPLCNLCNESLQRLEECSRCPRSYSGHFDTALLRR